jgi:DNA-binding LytR/AlgR family response regulator
MEKIKILIVEDDIFIATSLKETLEKSGHQITSISRNHAEAIDSIERTTPDIMLIDIRLKNSKADGIEIAAEVSKNYNIPFVYLTANAESHTFERAKLTKPAAYLLKPFRNNELVYQVELAYTHYLANKMDETNPLKAENVYLPLNGGHQKITKSDILFLKAEGAYVKVFVKEDKTPLLFSMNIGHLGQYFPNNFYQISRSLIINLDYLERFDAESIILKHFTEKILIPNNKLADLKKRLAVIKTPK